MNLVAPIEQQVVAAYQDAQKSGAAYAIKGIICGQLLLEMRQQMRVSHSGKPSSINGRNQHSDGDGFVDRAEALGIPKTNAYRYMQAAERISRAQLGIPMHEAFSPVIEIGGGETMSLSRALTAPEKGLPAAALKFRQGIFDFMAEHTLSEAAKAVVDGESDGKRITLAAGGKSTGGKGSGDRKAFEVFARTKLKHLTTFLGQKLNVNQKSQIETEFESALEKWPRWMIEALADKCRKELKLDEGERASRATFEKA